MNTAEEILNHLDFKPNEIELYKRIRLEIFLKTSDEDNNTLVSKILKMIDQEYL